MKKNKQTNNHKHIHDIDLLPELQLQESWGWHTHGNGMPKGDDNPPVQLTLTAELRAIITRLWEQFCAGAHGDGLDLPGISENHISDSGKLPKCALEKDCSL